MGLSNENQSVTFLNIGDGKISKKVKKPTETSVTRTTKEGKTVHEELYSNVSGYITDIKVHEHPQYGKFWNITIEDQGETFVLQMNYSGGYASSFLKALPNVDFRQTVRLSPYVKTVNDKKRVSLYINQNNETVQWYFTKEYPKGLPQMVKVKVKGQEQWDDTDMLEFLEEYVNKEVLPKVKNAVKIEPTKKEDGWDKLKEIAKKNEQPASIDDVADDLPF